MQYIVNFVHESFHHDDAPSLLAVPRQVNCGTVHASWRCCWRKPAVLFPGAVTWERKI